MDSSPSKPSEPAPETGERKRPKWYITVGMVIVVGVTTAGLVWVTMGLYKRNAERAAAAEELKSNPDLQVLQEDRLTNEITVRAKNNAGGELILFYDEDSHGYKVRKARVTGKNGENIAEPGATLAPPDWVLRYPGKSGRSSAFRSDHGRTASGFVSEETSDPVAKVKAYYDAKLKESGYLRSDNPFAKDTADETIFSVAKDNTYMMSFIITRKPDMTQVLVNYEGPGK